MSAAVVSTSVMGSAATMIHFGRGWAWAAYDWDEGRLVNYVGDAQNTFPIWNATPLVALDVYEHAYFLDYQTDRASYIEAFFRNLDWGVVNGWLASYGIR